MANKEVLDRKTLDKYRKQIEKDFRDNYEDELVQKLSEKVSNEVMEKFDDTYKKDIVDSVASDVKSGVKELVIDEEKRLVRGKSFKIFRLSVYLFVLIAIVIYVVFRLYITDNIDVIRYDYETPSIEEKARQILDRNQSTTTQQVKDFNYYKGIYGNILDNIKIIDVNLYKGSNNINTFTTEQKLQIAYSTLTPSDITNEGSIHSIKSSVLRNAYAKMFDINTYEDKTFDVFDVKFVYSQLKDEYIAIYDTLGTENILYEIYDITEDDNNIIVKAYVGKVLDNKLFNIQTNKEVANYTGTLADHKAKLSSSTFRFTKDRKFFSISNE